LAAFAFPHGRDRSVTCIDSDAFRKHGHELVDWIAEYLEAVTLGWFRRLIGLPDTFEGVICDTASIATLHAIVAARQAAVAGVRAKGRAGRSDVPRARVYCSDQAHSSIHVARAWELLTSHAANLR
jgi:glutamate/tyrosine decarboxylase-like PLP-dependent enzyme